MRSSPVYGWIPDKPDQRDVPYLAIRAPSWVPIELPQKIDLRPHCPPVYNQGKLGSCTAQAIVAAYEMELIKRPEHPDVKLSPLFLYYNARVGEGTTQVDSGSYIRDGVKAINQYGACLETMWPYAIEDFAKLPSDEAYQEALRHQAVLYASVDADTRSVCLALADGYPVIFGFTVYEYFESKEMASKGVLQLPKAGERPLGGHAVLAVGYDQEAQHLLVRNSWGDKWGLDGYFWMPFSYIRRLARDFWIIKDVE